MSQDLMPLEIAGQNMTANNPSRDLRPLFQAGRQHVHGNPVETLTLWPAERHPKQCPA